MKYKKVAIGLGLIILGGLIGSFIHIGGGSFAFIGCLIGLILCCLLIDSGPRSTISRWLSSSNKEQYGDAEMNAQVIANRTLSAREQHTFDEIRGLADKGRF